MLKAKLVKSKEPNFKIDFMPIIFAGQKMVFLNLMNVLKLLIIKNLNPLLIIETFCE